MNGSEMMIKGEIGMVLGRKDNLSDQFLHETSKFSNSEPFSLGWQSVMFQSLKKPLEILFPFEFKVQILIDCALIKKGECTNPHKNK